MIHLHKRVWTRAGTAGNSFSDFEIRRAPGNTEVEATLMKRNIAVATFCGACFALAANSSRLMAQAPPGPLPTPPASSLPPPRPVAAKPKPPEVPPRTSLDGPWKLNPDESDNPRTKIQDS